MAGDGGPGVIVEDVKYFHLGVIGQPPVGDIGLPQLVWHLGFPHCGVSVIVSQDMGIPLQDESDVGVPRFAR